MNDLRSFSNSPSVIWQGYLGETKHSGTKISRGLTGVTKATVDGKAASFTQVSSTEITVKVPSTAATGKIVVTTRAAVRPAILTVTP